MEMVEPDGPAAEAQAVLDTHVREIVRLAFRSREWVSLLARPR